MGHATLRALHGAYNAARAALCKSHQLWCMVHDLIHSAPGSGADDKFCVIVHHRLDSGPVRCIVLMLQARQNCCSVSPASRWERRRPAGLHAPELLAVEELRWTGECFPAVIQTMCAAVRPSSSPSAHACRTAARAFLSGCSLGCGRA